MFKCKYCGGEMIGIVSVQQDTLPPTTKKRYDCEDCGSCCIVTYEESKTDSAILEWEDDNNV